MNIFGSSSLIRLLTINFLFFFLFHFVPQSFPDITYTYKMHSSRFSSLELLLIVSFDDFACFWLEFLRTMVYLPDVSQTGAHNILFILALASSFFSPIPPIEFIYGMCTFFYDTADAFVLIKNFFLNIKS